MFWLPTEDLRLRFALVTLGARFTAFAIWSTGWRSTGVVTGDATFYYFHRGPDIRVSYEVFGAGLFARGSFLNWNVDFADENGDLRSVYAPLAEGGIWLRGTIPTMLGPGVDIMFGGAVDHDTGGIGFLRIEMFFGQHVDCHGRRRSCRTGN